VEDVIRRRFAVGSVMAERKLKEELLKQKYSEIAVNRAIYQLVSKEVLAYKDRRTKITRARA
jgi:hypothetical protein